MSESCVQRKKKKGNGDKTSRERKVKGIVTWQAEGEGYRRPEKLGEKEEGYGDKTKE